MPSMEHLAISPVNLMPRWERPAVEEYTHVKEFELGCTVVSYITLVPFFRSLPNLVKLDCRAMRANTEDYAPDHNYRPSKLMEALERFRNSLEELNISIDKNLTKRYRFGDLPLGSFSELPKLKRLSVEATMLFGPSYRVEDLNEITRDGMQENHFLLHRNRWISCHSQFII